MNSAIATTSGSPSPLELLAERNERLERELRGANATIAHFLGPDGEQHIDKFAALIAGQPEASTGEER